MYPTRYLALRDRRAWQAQRTALHADDDGVLMLTALPKPAQPVVLAAPYGSAPSGLAGGACCDVFVADTAHDTLWYRDGYCDTLARVSSAAEPCAGLGALHAPRGLAYGRAGLFVADAKRVVRLRAPDLRLAQVVNGPWLAPTGLALDAQGVLYVLDSADGTVWRIDARGKLDAGFRATLAAQVHQIQAIAVRHDGQLYAASAYDDAVWRIDTSGDALHALAPARSGWQPRALATYAARLAVADARDGRVYVYDDEAFVDAVPDYVGPVSALAFSSAGDLYIKPGLDAEYVVACVDAGHATFGQLVAGPFDAGEHDDWQRVALDVDTRGQARAQLAVFCAAADAPAPAETEWLAVPTHDALLDIVCGDLPQRAARRYVWLRVRVDAPAQADQVRIAQVRAMTTEEDYRQHLPAVYGEYDARRDLERFLALARSELGAGEQALADLARLMHPDFAAAQSLPWLAQWLAYDMPAGLSVSAQRALLGRIHAGYRLRGTVAGLLAAVHNAAGAKVRLVEWQQQQRVWQLDVTAALGFDTALPAASPDGMVVCDSTPLKRSTAAGTQEDCARIGHVVVGADRPQATGEFAQALLADGAHRVSVLVPAAQAPDAHWRAVIEDTVAAEVPAHVRYEVCFVEPQLRIGVQARIGLDAYVAGDGPPLRLAQAQLNVDTRLGGDDAPGRGIGQQARLGNSLALG